MQMQTYLNMVYVHSVADNVDLEFINRAIGLNCVLIAPHTAKITVSNVQKTSGNRT